MIINIADSDIIHLFRACEGNSLGYSELFGQTKCIIAQSKIIHLVGPMSGKIFQTIAFASMK